MTELLLVSFAAGPTISARIGIGAVAASRIALVVRASSVLQMTLCPQSSDVGAWCSLAIRFPFDVGCQLLLLRLTPDPYCRRRIGFASSGSPSA